MVAALSRSLSYRAEYTPRTGTESKYNAIAGLTTTILSDNGQYFIQLGEQLQSRRRSPRCTGSSPEPASS